MRCPAKSPHPNSSIYKKVAFVPAHISYICFDKLHTFFVSRLIHGVSSRRLIKHLITNILRRGFESLSLRKTKSMTPPSAGHFVCNGSDELARTRHGKQNGSERQRTDIDLVLSPSLKGSTKSIPLSPLKFYIDLRLKVPKRIQFLQPFCYFELKCCNFII